MAYDDMQQLSNPQEYYWRVGGSVECTIYALVDNRPDGAHSKQDMLLGCMFTPAAAHAAVTGHNARLAQAAGVE